MNPRVVEGARARIAARREAIGAELARRRRRSPRRWPRRLPLLLLLLLRCVEVPAPIEVATTEPPTADGPVMTDAPLPGGRISRRDRPSFHAPAPEPLPWLAAFRLQVASRGTRLAACFVGAPRPGALKWTVAVEPRTGRVSDATLLPTLASDDLTSAQRECALDVLADPPYALDPATAPSTPSRVGIVVEF